MVGILIEIKLPHSASQNKNSGCLERRSSTSSRNVNAELWSQPFKIGFTWINKSSDAVHEIAQEGRRLWVIICAAEHTLQIILTGYLWINTTCSVCSSLLCSDLMKNNEFLLNSIMLMSSFIVILSQRCSEVAWQTLFVLLRMCFTTLCFTSVHVEKIMENLNLFQNATVWCWVWSLAVHIPSVEVWSPHSHDQNERPIHLKICFHCRQNCAAGFIKKVQLV